MSIITDALKRAEHDRGQKLREKIGQAHAASVAEGTKPIQVLEEEEALLEKELEARPRISSVAWPQFSWQQANVYVLRGAFVIGLAVVVISLFMIFRWEATDQTPMATVSLPAISKPAPQAKKTIFSKRSPNHMTLAYTLSGISSFDNKHYAVINGLVLEPGDSVDGAVVKDVNDHEAILETRAGELRLRIPV